MRDFPKEHSKSSKIRGRTYVMPTSPIELLSDDDRTSTVPSARHHHSRIFSASRLAQ